jgi:cyclophilin family peptidyl-prolyl cis-trans isomerase
VASSDGGVRKAASAGGGSDEAREILGPGQRLSRDLDLAALLPSLSEPGTSLVTLAYPGFRSNTVRIQILEAYDPAAAYRADVETDRGRITLAFYPDVAPAHVRNFVNLARSGYYDGTLVHRVIPGIMFQAGDPTGTGRGGPGWTLKAEFSSRPHRAGTLAMARQSDNPDSAGAQWFICVDRVPEWDGLYTVFGEVVDGLEVAEAIAGIPVRGEAPREEVLIRRVAIRTVEPS